MVTFNPRNGLALGVLLGLCTCSTQAQEASARDEHLACAATMQSLFDKPYEYVRSAVIDGHQAHQFRNRESTYAFSCYIDGAAVIWRTDKSPSHTAPGRWRNHPLDEMISWSRSEGRVTIVQRYPDGSNGSDAYPIKKLEHLAKLPR